MPTRTAASVRTTSAPVDTLPAPVALPAAAVVDAGELLTAGEVAELLRIDVYTVRRYVKRGELRAFRVGRQLRIGTRDLETFLTGRRA